MGVQESVFVCMWVGERVCVCGYGCARERVCVCVVREREYVSVCQRLSVCVADGFYIVLFSSLRQSHCAVRERERERDGVCLQLCVYVATHMMLLWIVNYHL